MKIVLFNTFTPYMRGGAEILVDDLKYELEKRGHIVKLFKLPFQYDIYALPNMMLISKLLDFSDYDRIICFKFPAFYAMHRKKIVWLFHQYRQVYDLYDKPYGLETSGESAAIKEIIAYNDTIEIGEAFETYTNALEVSTRLKDYNGLNSKILTPPLRNWENYYNREYGNYIYYPSRVDGLKRQYLAVEAMRYVTSDVKLVLDGKCDNSDEGYKNKIFEAIAKYKLESKIVWKNTWITDEDKIEKMAGCLACLYLAYKEDSCGFVSVESFYSSKPIISCTDSGGTYELVENERTGYFVSPTPQALAQAMDKLYLDRKNTEKMGKAARKEIIKRNITWDEAIRRLTS